MADEAKDVAPIKPPPLPAEVYVQWVDWKDDDDKYLSINQEKVDAAGSDGGGKYVGVYKLVKVVSLTKTVKTTVREKAVNK